MPAELPRGEVAATNLDPEAVEKLVAQARQTDSDALVVLVGGKVVIEEYFGRPQTPIEAMSATKSIVALAVAKLVHDGDIASFDEPVHRFYPQWRQGKKQDITIRHLLNHTSGLQNVANTSVEIYPSRNFIELALAAELDAAPGTTFSYNNKAVNLLAGVVEKASGQRMDRYIGEHLFAPLGITDFGWSLDEAGNPHAMSGLQIHAVDLAKLGQLVLEGGKHRDVVIIGERVLSELMHPDEGRAGGSCGLLWWLVHERQELTVTPQLLERWREGGADSEFLARVQPLVGQRWSKMQFGAALRTAFGDDMELWHANTWKRGLPDVEVVNLGAVVAYRAEGFLGQHLVIVPALDLVAVRQNREVNDPESREGMPDFPDLVLTLGSSETIVRLASPQLRPPASGERQSRRRALPMPARGMD